VTDENSTSVSVYLPKDIFYDFWTHEKVLGEGSWVQLDNVPYTSIPLHIKGGSILALRAESVNTTTELRKQDFILWIAPNASNQAVGSLYLDEGDAIEQPNTSEIKFEYNNGLFKMTGTFEYFTESVIKNITVLGGETVGPGKEYGTQKTSATVTQVVPLTKDYSANL
jgi:alpha-glucosidase